MSVALRVEVVAAIQTSFFPLPLVHCSILLERIKYFFDAFIAGPLARNFRYQIPPCNFGFDLRPNLRRRLGRLDRFKTPSGLRGVDHLRF
jgi:hypothetical protein